MAPNFPMALLGGLSAKNMMISPYTFLALFRGGMWSKNMAHFKGKGEQEV
jgi:hypothetical protein